MSCSDVCKIWNGNSGSLCSLTNGGTSPLKTLDAEFPESYIGGITLVHSVDTFAIRIAPYG